MPLWCGCQRVSETKPLAFKKASQVTGILPLSKQHTSEPPAARLGVCPHVVPTDSRSPAPRATAGHHFFPRSPWYRLLPYFDRSREILRYSAAETVTVLP